MRTVLVIGVALVALLLLPVVLVVVRRIREQLSLRTVFKALGRVAFVMKDGKIFKGSSGAPPETKDR